MHNEIIDASHLYHFNNITLKDGLEFNIKIFDRGRIAFTTFKHVDIKGVKWWVHRTRSLVNGHREATIPVVKLE